MSGRRVVLRGSIRVDARRARAKLREHLLVDLHGYSLELARAASALGASAMNVSWDADEVAFAFDGPALPGERLARLLDFALSNAEDERAAPLRSLALGVNAALGLGAEAVTVTSTDDAAACAVRFTPELFADESDKPLELQAKSCAPPRDAFTRGTHVHVKKRLGLDVLKRAVSSSMPAEVALLIEHTAESPLRLSCGGSPAPRKPEPPLLARVPFTLPLARRAAVELRGPGAPCRIDVMERGVRLLTLSWTPLPGLGATEGLVAPVRVVVDADELPTNASRSALREDSPLARELLPAAEAAFRKLLAGLVARARREALPEGVEAPALTEQAWRVSLGTLVCLATAALRARHELDPEVRALFDLPLFDAPGGGRVSVGRVLSSRPVRVWRSKEDLPEELAPWLSDVVWLRGHFVERLLDDLDVEDAAGLVKRARQGAARRERFLAHAPGEPRVPPATAELLRQSFSTASGTTQGLRGEVVLLAPLPSGATRPSLLRVFVEERMLEALPIEPSFCPLAFDAAIAWPSALRPRFDYDGVERDARLNQALHAVTLAAIGVADRAAERLETLPEPERAALELVLRNAVATYSVVPARLGQNAPLAKRFQRDFLRLYRAPIYPTVAGDRVSLASLAGYAEKTRALCVASGLRDAPARPAPDGRPVVIAGGAEADAILALLDGKVERIPYDAPRPSDTPEGRRAALMRAVTDERVRQGLTPLSAKLWFEREGALVVVAPAVFAASIEQHRGVSLSCTARDDGLSSLIFAIDDPATVPNASWSGVHYKPKRQPGWFEQRFIERLVDALEGDPKARQALTLVSPLVSEDPALVWCLLGRAIQLRARVAARGGKPERPMDAKQRQLLARIEKLPILCSLDDAGAPAALSIAAISARHGESVPLLDTAPGFPTGDWQPLLVRSERERELLTRLFPRAASGAPELGQRRERALLEYQKQQLLARPAREIRDLDARCAAGDLVQHVRARPAAELLGELEVALALPPADLSPAVGWVSLCFAGRPIQLLGPSQIGLPIVANVSSTRASDFVAFSAPSQTGLARVGAMLREASFDLLQALARQGLLLSDGRALALCLALHDLGAGELVRLLFQGPNLRFPTVQGASAALGGLAANGSLLLFGSERYPEWLTSAERPSELDQPVLFLPPGDLGAQLAALLGRHGHELFDVSQALAALQRQRGGGAAAQPKLDGVPVHPALRASLGELGVTSGDGELELTRGPSSSVSVLLLDGRSESFEVDLPCPLRAVARVDALELRAVRARLTQELEAAARRLLVRAAAALDTLPPFVRHATRRALCLHPELRDDSALAAAAVFEDTGGLWHSLGGLVTEARWLYTTLEPPFPPAKRPILRLSDQEAAALRGGVELVKVDWRIERAREAERRRTAPQVASVMLTAEQRAACFVTAPVRADGVSGEVGVLSPARADARGGTLFVERRPLCKLDDGEGWPLVMALNDDAIVPDRFFEGPADRGVLSPLVRLARDVARVALERTFAPTAALAARWLEDEPAGGFRVTGCLWLGTTFPRAPKVRVYMGERAAPMVRALEARLDATPLGTALPLEGDLLVRWEGGAPEGKDAIALDIATTLTNLETLATTWDSLNELGVRVAADLVRDARSRGVDTPTLDDHALSLRLLGIDVPAPALVTSDGSPLEVGGVLEELARAGALWTSDGRGFSEGAFPAGMPRFFLPEGSALVRVLAARTPAGVLRSLGGLTAVRDLASPAPTDVPRDLSPPDLEAINEGPSWWERFTKALTRSLTGAAPVESSAPEHRALLALVLGLGLTGSPVESVATARSKRVLRYDEGGRRLLLSPTAAPASKLLRAGSQDPGALAVLAAHAVCEVNRALVEVTDGEEARALLALLKEL